MMERRRAPAAPRGALLSLLSLLALCVAAAAGKAKRPPTVLPLKRRPIHPHTVAGAIMGGQRRLAKASTQMELYSAEWGQGCDARGRPWTV